MAVPPDAPAGQAGRSIWILHLLAAAVLVVGIGVQVVRPLAPDLGPAPEASTAFDAAQIQRARDYRRPLYAVMAAALLLRVAVAIGVAWSRRGRATVARVVQRIGQHRPARAATVVIVGVIMLTDVLLLPLAFWAGFVHAGNYGLRTQGPAGWFYDWAVYHVPVWGGLAVLALLGYTLARRQPRLWAPLGAVATGVLGVALAFLSPLILEPLLFRFTPLEPGAVRTAVEETLAAAGEDADEIVVADASRRSIEQNAYISGLGTSERVVLFDTLVDERPPAEVGLVLAHELAHHRHRDVLRLAALGAAGAVAAAYVLHTVLQRRVRRGLQRGIADPSAAAVVLAVIVLLNAAAAPVQAFVSRRAEASADLAALTITDSPAVFERMQTGLTLANLSEPDPPTAVTLWWGSHPPPMARVGMARWWAQR